MDRDENPSEDSIVIGLGPLPTTVKFTPSQFLGI